MTDGLKIAHLRIAPPVGNPEVGDPDIYLIPPLEKNIIPPLEIDIFPPLLLEIIIIPLQPLEIIIFSPPDTHYPTIIS